MILVSAFTLLWAVLILAVLGLLFGLGLAIAAKVFYVEVDTRIEDITSKHFLNDSNVKART